MFFRILNFLIILCCLNFSVQLLAEFGEVGEPVREGPTLRNPHPEFKPDRVPLSPKELIPKVPKDSKSNENPQIVDYAHDADAAFKAKEARGGVGVLEDGLARAKVGVKAEIAKVKDIGLKERGIQYMDAAADKLKAVPGKVAGSVRSAPGKVVEGVKSAGKAVYNAPSAAKNTIKSELSGYRESRDYARSQKEKLASLKDTARAAEANYNQKVEDKSSRRVRRAAERDMRRANDALGNHRGKMKAELSTDFKNAGKKVARKTADLAGHLDTVADFAGGYQKEAEAAAKEDRDISYVNAAWESTKNVTGLAAGDRAMEIGKEESLKLERENKRGLNTETASAMARGAERTFTEMFHSGGKQASKEVLHEEFVNELRAIEKEGGDPSEFGLKNELKARTRAGVTVVGNVSGFNTILDATMTDYEADRAAGRTSRRLQDKIEDRLAVQLGAAMRVKDEIEQLSGSNDPAKKAELAQKKEEYERRLAEIDAEQNSYNKRGLVDQEDLGLIYLRGKRKELPSAATVEDTAIYLKGERKVIEPEVTENPVEPESVSEVESVTTVTVEESESNPTENAITTAPEDVTEEETVSTTEEEGSSDFAEDSTVNNEAEIAIESDGQSVGSSVVTTVTSSSESSTVSTSEVTEVVVPAATDQSSVENSVTVTRTVNEGAAVVPDTSSADIADFDDLFADFDTGEQAIANIKSGVQRSAERSRVNINSASSRAAVVSNSVSRAIGQSAREVRSNNERITTTVSRSIAERHRAVVTKNEAERQRAAAIQRQQQARQAQELARRQQEVLRARQAEQAARDRARAQQQAARSNSQRSPSGSAQRAPANRPSGGGYNGGGGSGGVVTGNCIFGVVGDDCF